MSLRLTVLAAVVIFSPVFVVPTVRAQEVTGRDEFVAAQAHYRAGEFVEAAEAFVRAYALDPRPPFLHNAFLAWRSAGRPREALEALDRFLASPGEASADDLARLREIRVALVAETEPASASEDDTAHDAAPGTAPSDATGAEPPSALEASAAETDEASVAHGAPPQEQAAIDAQPHGIEVPVEPGIALLAAAGASLIWALVENRVVDGIVSSRDAMCTLGPTGDACPGTLDQQPFVNDFVLHRDLGYGALGVGLALGAIGGTLLGMSLLGSAASASGPSLTASCGATGCGLSARGVW